MNPSTSSGGSASLTVHQLLRQFSPAYLQRFGHSMPQRQRQVLQRLLRCRTPELGGQLFACRPCERFAFRYHSCQERHCPQCGQTDADQWLERQRARLLLPVPYFLVTFTVPDALRAWIRSHPRLGYNLLFAASAQALADLAQNPRRLGAQLGLLGVLHTWTRQLLYHPHLHYLVPGGGLSADGRSWVATRRPAYLFNAFALAERGRTLFAEKLRAQSPEDFARVPRKVWKQRWVTNVEAVGSGQNALRYLSRYIFKTATGNRVLEALPGGKFRWPYRDSRTGQQTHVALDPHEFIRRFLQHVLPQGYHRARTFGWLHPAAKLRANRVRALLGAAPRLSTAEKQAWLPPPEEKESEPPEPLAQSAPGTRHAPCCPNCRLAMTLVATWKPGRAPPLFLARALST